MKSERIVSNKHEDFDSYGAELEDQLKEKLTMKKCLIQKKMIIAAIGSGGVSNQLKKKVASQNND